MSDCISRHQLHQYLTDQFDMVCFVDLAELRTSHRSVFDLLAQCYKPVYDHRERLILYTSAKPEQSLLDHIQQAAAALNISNFFILFVSPYDLSQSLEIANHRHGHDQVCMQHMIVSISDTMPYGPAGFADSAFLCPLPFMAVQIDPSGEVAPCCKYQGSCGSLKTSSLQHIFDGAQFRALRQQMIKGQQPPGCATCAQLEKTGEVSFRQSIMPKYGHIMHTQCVDSPQIVDLTVFPSSVCNFKCRICQPFYSTSIRSEEIRFAKDPGEKQRIKVEFPVHDHPEVQSVFFDAHIKPEFVHVLGGEPFLWPALPTIIDRYIHTGRSQNMQIEFNTNGSVFPSWLTASAGHFRMIEILISLDDVGTRFELQRGGSWSVVSQNLQHFADLNRHAGVSVKFLPTVNIQNLLYLDDLVNLADDLGFDIVWWGYLEKPSYLCIDNVTLAVKQRVKELYQNHPVTELRKLALQVEKTDPVSGDHFLEYTKKIDLRRNQDFRRFHQEICELMENTVH